MAGGSIGITSRLAKKIESLLLIGWTVLCDGSEPWFEALVLGTGGKIDKSDRVKQRKPFLIMVRKHEVQGLSWRILRSDGERGN